MDNQILYAFILYSFVAAITPGPNNIMLLTSGLNFGFKKTIAHMCGITFGFALMIIIVGTGINQLFKLYPIIYDIMQYVGTIYIIYLAIKIANISSFNIKKHRTKPMSFFDAAVFQWINPKAWLMGVVALSSYTIHQSFVTNITLIVVISALVGVPSLCFWAYFGVFLKQYLKTPKYVRIFNYIMSSLLIISIVPTIINIIKNLHFN